MNENDKLEKNCDHIGHPIYSWMISKTMSIPICSNCDQPLSQQQITVMVLKSKFMLEDIIEALEKGKSEP